MRYLRSKAKSLLGENVLLFTTDGNHDNPELKCGTIEGVYATVDFGVTSKWKCVEKEELVQKTLDTV